MKILPIQRWSFWGLIVLITATQSVRIDAAPLHDAVSGATVGPVPSPPLITVNGSPNITNNLINLGQTGGLVTITYTGSDLSASSYPGSLQIGTTAAGVCLANNSGLPPGAQISFTNNPATKPATQSTATITWNVPAGTPTTTINLCAYNNFWVDLNGMTTRPITIASGSTVSKVNIASAIYTAKKRTLSVKGTVTPVIMKPSLNGTTVEIEDSLTGNSIASTKVRSNRFTLSLKTVETAPPAMSLTALVSNTLSSSKPVTLIGKIDEVITLNTPDSDGAIINMPYLSQLKATDTLGNPISFSLQSGPAGMTITPGGLVSWTPNSGVGQTISYTVNAKSSTGISKTSSFSIGVCSPGSVWHASMNHCMEI